MKIWAQPGIYPAEGAKRGRVALLMGCVQSVIEPSINAATIRLLTRLGYEVVVTAGEACCGSLTHHMGKEADAIWRARRNVASLGQCKGRCGHHHRIGLRHDDQGLWLHAAP